MEQKWFIPVLEKNIGMDLYGILSEASVGNLYNLKTLSEKDQLMNQLKFEYFQMYKIKRKNWICIKKKKSGVF